MHEHKVIDGHAHCDLVATKYKGGSPVLAHPVSRLVFNHQEYA